MYDEGLDCEERGKPRFSGGVVHGSRDKVGDIIARIAIPLISRTEPFPRIYLHPLNDEWKTILE